MKTLISRSLVILSVLLLFHFSSAFSQGDNCGLNLSFKKGKYGYVNEKNKTVIKHKYCDATPFSDGVAAVCVEKDGVEKWGLINTKGKNVTDFKYEYLSSIKDGVAIAGIRGLDGSMYYGLVSSKGEEISSFDYDGITQYNQGIALVVRGGKWGAIGRDGKEVIAPAYDDIEYAGYDFLDVMSNGKYGCYTVGGKEVLPVEYDSPIGLFNYIVRGFKGEQVVFVNDDGTSPLIFEGYDYVGYESNGFHIVAKNGKMGAVNPSGDVVVPVKYDYLTDFIRSGIAFATLDGKEGALGKNGHEVVPVVYDSLKIHYGSKMIEAINCDGTLVVYDFDGEVLECEPVKDSFCYISTSAEFPGGISEMHEYIRRNLRYPERSRKNNSEGRVDVKFFVDVDGTACVLKLDKSSCDILLDKEAIRVVKSFPRWKPASVNGRKVRQLFSLPVSFKLQ